MATLVVIPQSYQRRHCAKRPGPNQHHPGLGPTIRGRQDGASPATIARSWKAQTRLSKRFAALAARKNVKSVVATAVARELAGFCWAEMTAND